MKELTTLRETEYSYMKRSLILRPVRLSGAPTNDLQSWDVFVKGAVGFMQDEDWAESRNKVLALREKLREGPSPVEQFLAVNRLHLPSIGVAGVTQNGYLGDRCAYFDAIEAKDLFVEL